MNHEENKHPNRWSPSMATASIVLSVIAVISLSISVPFAALALMLALLSRGGGTPGRRHRFAIALSSLALTASLIMTGFDLARFAADPEMRRQYKAYVDFILGTTDLTNTPSENISGNGILASAETEKETAENSTHKEKTIESKTDESEAADSKTHEGETAESETQPDSSHSSREPFAPLPGRHPMPQAI